MSAEGVTHDMWRNTLTDIDFTLKDNLHKLRQYKSGEVLILDFDNRNL